MTYAEMFQEIAQTYGLDWRLLAEQAWTESRLDALAVGKASSMGLLQIPPGIWATWAPRLGVTDPFDPYSNILVGAAYLAFLRDYVAQFGNREFYWVLLAYHWGAENVRRLLRAGGQWLDAPASRRDYALTIVLQANAHSLHRSGSAGSRDGHTTLAELLARPMPITSTTPLSVERKVKRSS